MKKILVVVDMQNDFISGTLGTLEAQGIVSNVIDKIKNFDGDIVFTQDTHSENYLESAEGKKLPVMHCILSSDGWKLNPDIEKLSQDCLIFEKQTFGCVELAKYISEQNYDEVELIGLCTDICVISNALLIKAFMPDICISVDSSCCAGVTPKSHENALEAMRMCQINIK